MWGFPPLGVLFLLWDLSMVEGFECCFCSFLSFLFEGGEGGGGGLGGTGFGGSGPCRDAHRFWV